MTYREKTDVGAYMKKCILIIPKKFLTLTYAETCDRLKSTLGRYYIDICTGPMQGLPRIVLTYSIINKIGGTIGENPKWYLKETAGVTRKNPRINPETEDSGARPEQSRFFEGRDQSTVECGARASHEDPGATPRGLVKWHHPH